jgi:hypothetical protein
MDIAVGTSNVWAIVVVVVVILIALCCFGCCISNANWRSNRIRECEAASEVFVTSLGEVEYSKKGSGPCIVCFHGSPAYHDGVTGWFDKWA